MCQLCAIAATFAARSSHKEPLIFDLSQFAATVETNKRQSKEKKSVAE
jgi:hypothetical protein